MKKLYISIFMFLMIYTISNAQVSVAVMELAGKGISEVEASALTDRLRTELFSTGKFKVIEREKMNEILSEQGLQQTGCVTDECIVQIGQLVGVEYIIGGSISKVGDVLSVSARIISVQSGEIVKVATYDYEGKIGNLLKMGMKKVAGDLSKASLTSIVKKTSPATPPTAPAKTPAPTTTSAPTPPVEPPGSLKINNFINGKLYVDGKFISDVQSGTEVPVKDLKAGMHKVEIQSTFGNFSTDVNIEQNKTFTLEAKLFNPTLEPVLDILPEFSNKMILIKGGTFLMGDSLGEGDSNERPFHEVTVNDFYMSQYEVTVMEYKQFCNETGKKMPQDPSWGWIDDHPIVNISWNDAKEYCNWLSKKTNNRYRFPTEAEWEYSAREGGKKVRFGNGKDIADPSEMNFDGKTMQTSYSIMGAYRGQTVSVGSFAPNSLGLYDMSGNVWELCEDWYEVDYYSKSSKVNPTGSQSGIYHVLRGGSWLDLPGALRATNRDYVNPNNTGKHIGFRVVMTF